MALAPQVLTLPGLSHWSLDRRREVATVTSSLMQELTAMLAFNSMDYLLLTRHHFESLPKHYINQKSLSLSS